MADNAKDHRIESDNPTSLDRLPGSKWIDGDVLVREITARCVCKGVPLIRANFMSSKGQSSGLIASVFLVRSLPLAQIAGLFMVIARTWSTGSHEPRSDAVGA
jgi:hypothetical protein